MHMIRAFRILFTAVAVLALPTAAGAAETGGCESFAWPLATELQWMKAADSDAAASGAKLAAPPAKAVTLALQPTDKVSFPVTPTGKPKGDTAQTFGGFVDFAAAEKPGVQQVTIASSGWIDIVQNGKTLKPTGHTGKSDCDGVRKSVRFDVGAGPFTLELSGVKKDQIKFSIRHID
jgi:hypothetical protein